MAIIALFCGNARLATGGVVSDRGSPAPGSTVTWWISIVWIAIAALATLTALGFLSASIFMARFRYIAPEPELLNYAEGLDSDESQAATDRREGAVDAVTVLKKALARQYAIATHHNRQINQRRALWRSIAGLATLASVLATLFLAATVTLHYVPKSHRRTGNVGVGSGSIVPGSHRDPALCSPKP